MSRELSDPETGLRAMSYILLGILQRLDGMEPGLITDLLDGAIADREASMTHADVTPSVRATFDRAVELLERANQQNKT